MKILLMAVNAKYIHSNLAVYSLKSYARKFASSIHIVEYTINQQKDEILKDLFLKRPDVLCFSCYIWNISFIKELISDIHKILPDTQIWAGGPEVSYDAVRFLSECTPVLGVMIGEGEASFLNIAEHYWKGNYDFSDINGLVFRKENRLTATPQREIMDMDKIPFVYDDISLFEHKIIYYESSRGCPFSCSYCLSSIDKQLRFRSFELIKKELGILIDKQVPQVKFVDRTFNCRHSHAMAIWEYIAEHDNGITNFHFEIAADLLTNEELACISGMRPGLIQLEIGVQSTNPRTLDAIRRKMDFKEVQSKVSRLADGKNVHLHLDLIAGLPYEDYSSFQKSFNEVYELLPNQLQLGFLKVLKGSYMEEQVKQYDCQYQEKEPYEVLSTKWISYREVLDLKGVEEMVEVYYNSGQFTHTLRAVVKNFKTPFEFYRELARFYAGKEYDGISHNRIRRYEILLEFLNFWAGRTGSEDELPGYYKELLLYDLYIRENLKSRPSWASDQNRFKEKIRRFYQREEEEHRYLKEYDGYQARQLRNMTHMEVFTYDVCSEYKKKGALSREYYVLFDYRIRNPLTYDAAVHAVEM